ncbi:hypothetical protein WJX72_002037 [[Myrmecia] bisecta]|uniref:Uncharacterized protein n=1 Tax=[Myrmecia] bisecta TaxID=41462 RepID=A0AAW1Q779_9CHLO
MPVSDAKLVDRLQQLLASVDLQTTTEKQLRKQLEEEFGEELSDRKALIRGEVQKYLDEQEDAEQDDGQEEVGEEEAAADVAPSDEEDEEQPKRGTKRKATEQSQGGGFGSKLSEPMQAFLGEERLPRPQVVKRIWEYIREHGLQDPKDKRRILPDERLATILKAPVTMLTMNKQLSRHVFTDDRTSAPRARLPAKVTVGEQKEPKARTGPNPLMKPLRASPELAAFLGGRETISRPELTSAFWAYVKANDLQDPDNKKEIICDDALRVFCKEDRFSGFGFMRFFKDHLSPIE